MTHDEGHEHRFHWFALDGDGMDELNLKPDGSAKFCPACRTI